MAAADLSGLWTGRYWYDEPGAPTVPFVATMGEVDSELSGTITEPNSVGVSSAELTAHIDGAREGAAVRFAKTYDGASDLAHRVDYAGTVEDDATLIVGRWTLADRSGGFDMRRPRLDVAEEAEATETLPVAINAPLEQDIE